MPPNKLRRRRLSNGRRRHAGVMNVAALTLLAEPRSPGSERTWAKPAAEFMSEDPTVVSEATTAAVLASATVRDGGRKCSPLAPGGWVRLPGALRRHQLPQRPIGPEKPSQTVPTPGVHHPHRHRAGRVWQGDGSLLAENCRQA